MTSETTASAARAIPATPITHWIACSTASSEPMPSGFDGSGCPTTSVTSTGPARNIEVKIPSAKPATMAYGSHRQDDDAGRPDGNSAMSRTTAPTGTRKIHVWSQTANEENGRPPGFVYSAYSA